jgi:hypothetical protein
MGLKARKTQLEAKGRKVIRYESRWLRRFTRSEKRFRKWLKKFNPTYPETKALASVGARKIAYKRWAWPSPMGSMGAMMDPKAVPVEG